MLLRLKTRKMKRIMRQTEYQLIRRKRNNLRTLFQSFFPVISVIFKLHVRIVFGNILSLNMKVSGILVISVIIKLHKRFIFSLTYQQSTVTQL